MVVGLSFLTIIGIYNKRTRESGELTYNLMFEYKRGP